MEWKQPPQWLRKITDQTTKKDIVAVLRERRLKKTFMDRKDLNNYLDTSLRWPWLFTWRAEQEQAIKLFFEETKYKEIVVQAVFGSGKTTMMLSIIQTLLMYEYCKAPQVVVLAFNVAIKNEIRKKLKNTSLNIKTYDSMIYSMCSELGAEDLRLPNFEGKRRYVRENLEKVVPNKYVRFVFVDEAQDLEKPCYRILRHRFPRARFLFIGDIFQSIQKEPRESLLWFLLQTPSVDRSVVTMKDTPRVPKKILHEISSALTLFYPEFKDTITGWTSSNDVSTSKIKWRAFTSYKEVYDKLLKFCKTHPASDVMILTFSSAITVRGSLGDVARVRKFLTLNGILTNNNHKNMVDDRVFLSTANSSKGLERKHVFCFLTFPLEKAFSNFSDDLVVNILTVALSRAKETVAIYIPAHKDRFSTALDFYGKCPKPVVEGKPLKTKKPKPVNTDSYVNIYDMKEMLEQEHGVTELIRQNILSFETKSLLKSFVKRYNSSLIPFVHLESFRTEEGCAFVGILFESLILSTWTNRWTTSACTEDTVIQHDVFIHFSPMMNALRSKYLSFIRKTPFAQGQDRRVFEGCILYARLHIACYQKLFVNNTREEEEILYNSWKKLRPIVPSLRPLCDLSKLKIQSNVAMPFVTGIADALVLTDPLEVVEIKSSRSPEWMENALVQSILYGLMMGRSYFKVHLLNVSYKEMDSYAISFKGKLMDVRAQVQLDVALWNLNCFLAKNVTHNEKDKDRLNTEGMFFLDGREKENVYTLGEMLSPTRFYVLLHNCPRAEIDAKIGHLMEKKQIQRLVIGRHLSHGSFDYSVQTTKLEFLMGGWQGFLRTIGWKEGEGTSPLHWDNPFATLSVQLCQLCKEYNF